MDFSKKTQKDLITKTSYSNIVIFKDSDFNFLYKKTERVSTAIYLITNLMNTEEPIKWQMRKICLDLLDSVMTLSNTTLSARDSQIREISKTLFHLISLYDISYHAGFISLMNYQIVKEELNKLTEFLNGYNQNDADSRNNMFAGDFFQKDIEKDIEKNRQNKDSFKDRAYKGHTPEMSDKMSYKSIKDNTTNQTVNKSHDRNERRDKIINIIKQKKVVSVKDVSNLIKDTSEKTIQRELISMVDDGILEKEGERRWSRYMLKN